MKSLTSKQRALHSLLGLIASAAMSTDIALAESNFSGGVWGSYQYLPDDKANTNTNGEFTGEALIIYADGKADDGGKWLYSAEARFGPGSFTDPDNNSTGDQFTLHKAWVGWQLNEQHILRVGKSQVPFGWKNRQLLAWRYFVGRLWRPDGCRLQTQRHAASLAIRLRLLRLRRLGRHQHRYRR